MAKAEAGLEFLVRKAPSSNRKDLVGNLRKGNSTAAVFEVLMARALVNGFGEDAVAPYPRIAKGSKKSIEFKVTTESRDLFFEATALFNDKTEAYKRDFCLREGTPYPIRFISGNEGFRRLFLKGRDKILQREIDGPLVLCLNQYAILPHPQVVERPLADLTAYANSDQNCPLVAVAYWWRELFHSFNRAEVVAERLKVEPSMLSRVEGSMRSLWRGEEASS